MTLWQTINCGTPYDGRYEASTSGLVRRVPQIVLGQYLPALILTPRPAKGYLQCSLTVDGRDAYPYVHHMVLWAFRGLAPEGHEASHLDGSRDNNRLGNLIWESRAANNRRRHEHGTMPCKLSTADVIALRAQPRTMSHREAAAFYGVHKETVARIRQGRYRKNG